MLRERQTADHTGNRRAVQCRRQFVLFRQLTCAKNELCSIRGLSLPRDAGHHVARQRTPGALLAIYHTVMMMRTNLLSKSTARSGSHPHRRALERGLLQGAEMAILSSFFSPA